MKKILISIGVILLIAVSVSLTIKSRTNNSLFDANVEALARTEGGLGSMCSQTCVKGIHYLKCCSNCNGAFGYYDNSHLAYCTN